MDRPALPAAELDERAWGVLRWRQDHLPLGKLRRHGDWAALGNLERAAATRIADDLGLDDDQRCSLMSHHDTEVARRAAAARPASPRARASRRPGGATLAVRPAPGWAAWLGNRWVSVRDRWFRLRTLGSYRHAPQP